MALKPKAEREAEKDHKVGEAKKLKYEYADLKRMPAAQHLIVWANGVVADRMSRAFGTFDHGEKATHVDFANGVSFVIRHINEMAKVEEERSKKSPRSKRGQSTPASPRAES